MSTSSAPSTAPSATTQPAAAQGAPAPIPSEQLPATDVVEVDDNAEGHDSTFGGSDGQSETMSIPSAISRGYIENGRRYQCLREDGYLQPTDEKQWEVMDNADLLFLILDCQRKEPHFRAEIGQKAQNVLDIGTGDGTWAIKVAEKYPGCTVYGVDLYPPPQSWVPPNCVLEVDDVSKDWTWNKTWNFIHMRHLIGAFNEADWKKLYKQAYDNLAPGGWIEHLEEDISICCDDNTLPANSILRDATFGDMLHRAGNKAGRPLDNFDHMKSRIEAAGFTDVQEQLYKIPFGSWPKHQVYKDAGRVNSRVWKQGLEGWCMWLLTTSGEPKPWSLEEVNVWLQKVRKEIDNPGYHCYQKARRVWARKPFAVKAGED